jgi:rubrerythrin
VPDALKLSPEASQALADTLPFLLCEEESAVHAFGSSLMRPSAKTDRSVLHEIAQDEARHAQWLGLLAARLPRPVHQLDQHHVQRLFRSMLTRNRGLHFARVAALDLAVCSLLHGITHHCSPLKQDA